MRFHFSGHLFALAIFVGLNLADAITTGIGLASGIPEGNPLPALILARAGMGGFLAVKLAITVAAARVRYAPEAGAVVLAVPVLSNLALIL